MIVLKVKTKAGHIQDLQVEELISIDGRDYQVSKSLGDRVDALERMVSEIIDWINQPTTPPPEEGKPTDAVVRN